MTDFHTELTGDTEVRVMLERLKRPYFLRPAFQRIAVAIKTAMKRYPPPPPNSTYRRTGTLGRRWTYRTNSSLFSVTAIVGNNTAYAPLVQDAEAQAEVHRGRWQTAQQVLADSGPLIDEEINKAIEKELGI